MAHPGQLPPLLTVAETAEILRSTKQAIYRRIRRGTLPCVRDGRRVLVPGPAIEAILTKTRRSDANTGSSSRGPRGQEPCVPHDYPCKTKNSWYSIVECKKGRARWAANFYIYGPGSTRAKNLRRRSPHTSQADTHRWAQQLLTELEPKPDTAKPRAPPPTVREACERWLATQDRDRANKTRHIHWLQQVWGADTMIDTLDHEQITGLPARLARPLGNRAKAKSRRRRAEGSGRRKRKGEGLSPGTIRAICQTGSRILAFSDQMGWRNAAKIPLPSVPITDAEWFTVEELAAVLAIAGDWHLAFMLGARAGLRRGEIVELRWKDVDLAHARIRVRRAYKRDDETGEWKVGPPKGGRPRTVPIPPDLVEALAASRSSSKNNAFVVQADGDRIEPWRLTEAVFKIAREAGIDRPGIGAHALRHSYCSHLAQGGAPTRAIQALAGHRSARTTERYMHLAPSHVEQAIAHLPTLSQSAETVGKHPRSRHLQLVPRSS